LYGHAKLAPASALGGECYSYTGSGKEDTKAGSVKATPKQQSKNELKKEPVKQDDKKDNKPKPKVEKKQDNDVKSKPAENRKPQASKKPEPKPAESVKPKPSPTKPAPKADPPKPAVKAEKPKPAKSSKPSKTTTALKIGNDFVTTVGEGGCRGSGWSKGQWPMDSGRKTLEACAKACQNEKCTAFHILKEENGVFDCFLFGHKDVISVRGLGGHCKKLSDKPEAVSTSTVDADDDEDEEETELKAPVYMALLGKGRCRGQGWSFKRWPTIKGSLTAQQCAEACARRKGCTAFDLSEQQDDKTFECGLYGHKKVQPAYGVPGNCFVLSDKPGAVPATVNSDNEEEEDDDDDDEELSVTGEVEYHSLGNGRCRGAGWASKKWPVLRGSVSPKDCAVACAKRRGCTSFDIGAGANTEDECALYGHKKVAAASGVAGTCYKLGKSSAPVEQEEPEEEEEEEDEDDGKKHKFHLLGKGMCRGANWQGKKWPAVRGLKTLQECANACGRKKGCTAFDTSSPDPAGGNKFDCMLYGHKHPVPAPGVPGQCYTLEGARFVEEEKTPVPADSTSRGKILVEDDQDFINIKDVELLGKGACRGQGWQSGQWPVSKGRKTLKSCAESCKSTTGCVAFDLSNKEGDKYDCLLVGHREVLPASALAAKCFVIRGAKPVASTLKESLAKSGGSAAGKGHGDYPAGGYGFELLGSGLCRGSGWQSNGWPVDKGDVQSLKECASACAKKSGCTAFDLSRRDAASGSSKKSLNCLLFNHKAVSAASALEGACYVKQQGSTTPLSHEEAPDESSSEEEEEEEEVIIDLEGDVDVALLGKGGCRGANWQEGGWPKVKGFLSVGECGRLCVATAGCTAFHAGYPKEGKPNVFECFLFGHKSVVPASGLTGNCYTVATAAAGGRPVLSRPAKKQPAAAKKKKKQYKIPEFDEPKVVEDTFDEEDEWLFEPPPAEIRSREHITQILGLAEPSNADVLQVTETTLKDLKKVYTSSIQQLEKMYKYKELSNRHFGDPEIFNKPLIVLMGPWSGGKSSIINYLLGTEYTKNAFRSSAEPSPGFNFNLAMYGESDEEVDGTQLAAEWAFSSLQKFGQEFLKKLRGKKMPNKLLEKATFAEIPGVLETGTIRKIDRRYPFNDACQWFIDHADLIVLVYDYAKLDIGPETEALLDQLKGREQQVRILLNKADEITAEELLKIQGNLVWNVSPLMASAEPPTLYAGSFWSRPYKTGAPKRLLKAQEQSLIKDIKEAIDKRVENRISTARRFAVRVRNHAKMVDCYLTTYKNNKGLFGDKKRVAQDIIDNPGKYHIYEGLSTLTNISRYDLPDPDTYRDFFNVHPLYDFDTLQSTCTFFKGCPLNKLDIAIAYDLPEIVTNYKKKVQLALNPPKVTIKQEKSKPKTKSK